MAKSTMPSDGDNVTLAFGTCLSHALTNLSKGFWAAAEIMCDLLRYYLEMASLLLPPV